MWDHIFLGEYCISFYLGNGPRAEVSRWTINPRPEVGGAGRYWEEVDRPRVPSSVLFRKKLTQQQHLSNQPWDLQAGTTPQMSLTFIGSVPWAQPPRKASWVEMRLHQGALERENFPNDLRRVVYSWVSLCVSKCFLREPRRLGKDIFQGIGNTFFKANYVFSNFSLTRL